MWNLCNMTSFLEKSLDIVLSEDILATTGLNHWKIYWRNSMRFMIFFKSRKIIHQKYNDTFFLFKIVSRSVVSGIISGIINADEQRGSMTWFRKAFLCRTFIDNIPVLYFPDGNFQLKLKLIEHVVLGHCFLFKESIWPSNGYIANIFELRSENTFSLLDLSFDWSMFYTTDVHSLRSALVLLT